jgi:hypothetical protein
MASKRLLSKVPMNRDARLMRMRTLANILAIPRLLVIGCFLILTLTPMFRVGIQIKKQIHVLRIYHIDPDRI